MNPERQSARRRLYLDTSAYLCILLAEEGWERLADETHDAELMSSVLLVLESKRTLVRLAREALLTADEYKACMDQIDTDSNAFVLRDLTLEICASNLLPAIATPRSFDLAHLRTAMWFHSPEPIDRFVTMDAAQAQAAKDLGLPL